MALSQTELAGLFSTGDGDWRTPQPLFDQLNFIFHFELDAAADGSNNLCPRFLCKEDDSLAIPTWQMAHEPIKSIWLNPPFGKGLFEWMTKVVIEASRVPRPLIACLLPVRPDTNWGQLILGHSRLVLFFRGRVRYVHPDPERSQKSPGFPSMLCIVAKNSMLFPNMLPPLRKLGQVFYKA